MINFKRFVPLLLQATTGTAMVTMLLMLTSQMAVSEKRDKLFDQQAAAHKEERRLVDASRFLAQMADGQAHRRLPFVVQQPITVRAIVGGEASSLAFAVQSETGSSCQLFTDAYGSLADEVIWLRAKQLECNGMRVPVAGVIRHDNGQVIDAQIFDIDSTTLGLRTGSDLHLVAWLDK